MDADESGQPVAMASASSQAAGRLQAAVTLKSAEASVERYDDEGQQRSIG
jgi:hypothetical protein